MTDDMLRGQEIKRRREALSLSQEELAERATALRRAEQGPEVSGVDAQSVSRAEEGRSHGKTYAILERALSDWEANVGPPDVEITAVQSERGTWTIRVKGPVTDMPQLVDNIARLIGMVDPKD